MVAEADRVSTGPRSGKRKHPKKMAGSHHDDGYVQLWPQFFCKYLGRNLKLCHKMESGRGGFPPCFF